MWFLGTSSIPPNQPVEVHGFISSKRRRQKKHSRWTMGILFQVRHLQVEHVVPRCSIYMAYLPTKRGSFGGFHVGKYTIHTLSICFFRSRDQGIQTRGPQVSLPWEKLQALGDFNDLTGDPAVMLGDLQRQEEHCRSWVLLGIAAIPEGLSRDYILKKLMVFF